MLPIKLPQEDVDKLMEDAERGSNATLTIDLEKQEIRRPDGGVIKFDIDPFRKHCLLNGLDDVGLTLQHETRSTISRAARTPTSPGWRHSSFAADANGFAYTRGGAASRSRFRLASFGRYLSSIAACGGRRLKMPLPASRYCPSPFSASAKPLSEIGMPMPASSVW